ncbi:ATP-binding protein [Kitasatospora sp. NPDC059646]|uniref:ATP-binding protein n=1 Tax=Kitasatospora sp. NPDC059646 TaxID=3346893 RepID=UPI003688FD63
MTGHQRHRRRPHTPPSPGPARAVRTYRASLECRPASIGPARRLAVTVLTAWGVRPRTTVHDAAVLAVTELAVNAVRHAATRSACFALVLSADAEHLDVSVHDGHPGLLAVPAPGTAGGLAVLADLARSLGGELTVHPAGGGGKEVRARLPLAPTAPETESP